MTAVQAVYRGGSAGRWAQVPVPQPVPTGPVPTPERIPPSIGDPVPEPSVSIREPGIIKPPQAARGRPGVCH